MGKIRFNVPVDLIDGNGFEGEVEEASTTRIVYEDGDVRVQYDGVFEISGGEPLDGTIRGLAVSAGGETLYTGKGLDVDLSDHIELWDDEGYIEAATILFGGSDTMIGGAGDDVIRGFGGKDKLKGGEGDDELLGDDGNDKLKGQEDDDTLFGRKGEDKLKGNEGSDFLYGGGGKDKLKGNQGNDFLFGEAGDDKLKGGGGADTFVIDDNDGRDLVKNFEEGVDRVGITGGSRLTEVDIVRDEDGVTLTLGATEMFLKGVEEFGQDDLVLL